MAHLSRLDNDLRQLLRKQRVAALGTLGRDGAPLVSMVPFAIVPPTSTLVLHVSALAAHTGNMAHSPTVSMMVMQSEVAGAPVHALPRVSLLGRVETLERGSAPWQAARDAYLARCPEAEPMMQLGDFRLLSFQPAQVRHVAGFGAARSVEVDHLTQLLAENQASEGTMPHADGDTRLPG